MKISHILLLVLTFSTNLCAKIDRQDVAEEEKKQIAQLQATCTIEILKSKLKYAHHNKPLNDEDFINELKALYDTCSSVINSPHNNPEQPKLTQDEWVYKSQRETYTLRQDDETRNCVSKAMSDLKQLQNAQSQDEKDALIKNFMQSIENCSYQHALKISLPHLEAQIQRWDNNQETQKIDFIFFKFFIQHASDTTKDLMEDLKDIYTRCNVEIPFEEFALGMQKKLNSIKKNTRARQCLELLIHFKDVYDAAVTEEDKNNLKKDFAVNYLQCKNK